MAGMGKSGVLLGLSALLAGCDLWIFPAELCDDSVTRTRYYLDADHDGLGDPATGGGCFPKEQYVSNAEDCDDTNAARRGKYTWYRDDDNDGYGRTGEFQRACEPPPGYGAFETGDCDDTDPRFSVLCRSSSLAVGFQHSCALRSDGTAYCWGGEREGDSPPRRERYTQITSGREFSCGLRADQSVGCWGSLSASDFFYRDQDKPPKNDLFTKISAGSYYVCGLLNDRTPRCWGDDTIVSDTPTSQEFIDLATGAYACGLKENGSMLCWGGTDTPQLKGGDYRQLAVGGAEDYGFVCGLHQDGTVSCWHQSDPPADLHFRSIAAGTEHMCGILEEGTAYCWGADYAGQASPPEDVTFDAIGGGYTHSCGLQTDGIVRCWGGNSLGQSQPPPSTWLEMDAGRSFTVGSTGSLRSWGDTLPNWLLYPAQFTTGGSHTCALYANGALSCWGENASGQGNIPENGNYSAVTAGFGFTCTLVKGEKDNVRCWGLGDDGPGTPPTGTFRMISAESYHVCGIKADGRLSCWSDPGDPMENVVPPAGNDFVSVDMGYYHACALSSDGRVRCWGCGLNNEGTPTQRGQCSAPSDSDFVQISVGQYHSCARHVDGRAECWGDPNEGGQVPAEWEATQFTDLKAAYDRSCGVTAGGEVDCWGADYGEAPADVAFQTVEIGVYHACGLDAAGLLHCWPENDPYQNRPPDGPTQCGKVAAGTSHACAACLEGTVCAGDDSFGQSTPPSAKDFEQLASGEHHSCGLLEGTITCWGDDSFGQSTVPRSLRASVFIGVTTGLNTTCGLDSAYRAHCWGDLTAGEDQIPDLQFSKIDAGYSHVCGLDLDGFAHCWGAGADGQTRVPEDLSQMPFVDIRGGGWHSCALDAAGHAYCWGNDTYLQVGDTPPWVLTKIVAGAEHNCGLKLDGTLYCWGRDLEGQTEVSLPWEE